MISKLILGNYDTVIACKTEKGSVWQKNRFKTINEKNKSRDHTEKMLIHNNRAIKVKKGKKNLIEINGKESLKPINITVPGDPSSASFYAALCILNKNSKIVLKQVHINDSRNGFF